MILLCAQSLKFVERNILLRFLSAKKFNHISLRQLLNKCSFIIVLLSPPHRPPSQPSACFSLCVCVCELEVLFYLLVISKFLDAYVMLLQRIEENKKLALRTFAVKLIALRSRRFLKCD